MSDPELIDVTVALKHETAKAWLVSDGAKDVWVPKSQGDLADDGKVFTLTLPLWLAKDKGLV